MASKEKETLKKEEERSNSREQSLPAFIYLKIDEFMVSCQIVFLNSSDTC